jgi:nitrate/nitrite-specific signal transduction histidine kinase
MGLRVMNYRARMIGATIQVRRPKGGGITVTCSLPKAAGLKKPEGESDRTTV